jgi:hypothetical protein
MKKQALTFIGVLSLVLAAGSAVAQSGEIRATVPFDFVVNHTTLPAGDYAIATIGGANQTLVIHGLRNKGTRMVNANHALANKPSDRTKLVFLCYGDRYFLWQIWTAGSDSGRTLPKSDLESEVSLDSTPHEVVLYASLR